MTQYFAALVACSIAPSPAVLFLRLFDGYHQCGTCDFRLGRVPSRDWPPGSKRPVMKYRSEYPRTGNGQLVG